MVSNSSTGLVPTNKGNIIQSACYKRGSAIQIEFITEDRVIKRVGDNDNKVDKIDIINTTNIWSVKINSQSQSKTAKS